MTITTIKTATNELKKATYEDGTYDLNTMETVSYDNGYQVTFCNIGDNYTDEETMELINLFLTESIVPVVYAGKFESEPEISFRIADKEKAIELAKRFNQISIWDWSEMDEIKTGGTGRRE